MTVSLDLTPEEKQRLGELTRECDGDKDAALRKLLGRPATVVPMDALEALRRVRESADPQATQAAILKEQARQAAELFDEWTEEEAALTPEEIAKDDAEWEQTKANINRYRAEEGRGPAFA